jgi:uncharacterized protein YbbK (DUF523 family)
VAHSDGPGDAAGGPVAGAGGPVAGAGRSVAGARRPVILVSACLLGVACNHRGRSSPSSAVSDLGRSARLVPVCPEVAGGLATPRPAAELQPDGRLRTNSGEGVTEAYLRGAAHAVDLARATGATRAVLKARSPSCGCHQVYDGTFSSTLRLGLGITAAALLGAGVEVVSEEDLASVVGVVGRAAAAPPVADTPTMDRPGA